MSFLAYCESINVALRFFTSDVTESPKQDLDYIYVHNLNIRQTPSDFSLDFLVKKLAGSKYECIEHRVTPKPKKVQKILK